MENPFETILVRLDTIEKKLDELKKDKNPDVSNAIMTIEEVGTYINYKKNFSVWFS